MTNPSNTMESQFALPPGSRVLLTGAAGFIASNVAELLLAAGCTVVGLDNMNDAYDTRLKEWRLKQLEERPGFEFHQVDLGDRDALSQLFEGDTPFSAVINLAARAGVHQSVKNPWVYIDTNVTGTLNLLELCRQTGVTKFILASTSSLYGAKNAIPFSEDDDTDGPLSPYAASKKAAEALCHTYHFLYDLDVTIFRFFTVYGPAGRPDMSLFRFVQWTSEGHPLLVFGDGQQSRDFTYVGDIARGVVAGLKPLGYEVINLGSDKPVVLNDAIQVIEELVGKEAILDHQPEHKADVRATWANIDKAEQLLGWRPQVSFVDGISELVTWYQTNRAWASDIKTV